MAMLTRLIDMVLVRPSMIIGASGGESIKRLQRKQPSLVQIEPKRHIDALTIHSPLLTNVSVLCCKTAGATLTLSQVTVLINTRLHFPSVPCKKKKCFVGDR